MRTIIAGSRTITDPAVVEQAIRDSGFTITEVVSGGARGVDWLGGQWARKKRIQTRFFHAEWGRFGKRAGPIRNRTMARYAEALIAIWDGSSRGTADMIRRAQSLGLRVFVLTVEHTKPLTAD